MNSKLVFKFHTRSADEVYVRADDPDEASQRLRDFLGGEPGAYRHISGIRIRTEIPKGEQHRDFEWDDPTMAQVIRAWFEDEELQDIAAHGMSAGWAHFTYYKETIEFYERFEDEVFAVIDEMAEQFGVRDVLQALAQYSNLEVHTPTDWKNGVVWVAAEQVVRSLVDDLERAAEDDEVEAEVVSV